MSGIKKIVRNIVVFIITWEAHMVLKKYKPQIIAITGSVGKTGTKDAIFAALENSLFVRKSEKTLNSEIGVPLTILGCESGWNNPVKWFKNILEGLALIFLRNHYPKWLVLEVGVDRPGDIASLTKWLKPDITIITALPDVPTHVENFKDPQDVAREKRLLAEALKPEGTLILGGDDKRTASLKKDFSQINTIMYGIESHNDIVGSHTSIFYDTEGHPSGMQFKVDEKGSSIPIKIEGRIGQQQVYPILAAFAVARAVGIPPLSITKGIEHSGASRGRMRILEGHNNTTIIDDSYNSSPTAVRAALSTLKKVETKGKKIAVLGDMLELGRFSSDAHKKVGVQVAGVADVLITVGVRAKTIAQSAREAGFDIECIQEFDVGDSKEAGAVVRAMLEPNDVVLVKGSQTGIRLEKAVREMLKEPQRAKELLVRQEDEWLAR
ncbi:UDP-N-acetylmuramoyl-tripeptide--D-alanyl-D-alanine ligase [Candidatus Kaiserbacteria bacterium]|nr:MAG: UDP-N-acetylmuramoyl-tripeptide--D-alanyl-D-alanine ligase [Candidatus Kaiserbacteria bacterium]